MLRRWPCVAAADAACELAAASLSAAGQELLTALCCRAAGTIQPGLTRGLGLQGLGERDDTAEASAWLSCCPYCIHT